MIELTQEQHQAMLTAKKPAMVYDPATNATFVLLPTEVYKKIQSHID